MKEFRKIEKYYKGILPDDVLDVIAKDYDLITQTQQKEISASKKKTEVNKITFNLRFA